MRRARALDDAAFALQRQGELGLWLQSRGQEAAQVGSITAVNSTDHVFPSYREHAAALSRGISPAELLIQWRGNRHSGWDPQKYRFHINTLVLAAQLHHATGYAMGVQRDGADELVLTYFGDGASSEGDAGEAFNWAATMDCPVVFFCQNNNWAISTPSERQMRSPLHQRAAGYGLDSYLVDGNDVLAVHAVTRIVADRVRAGAGPAFIEAVTYRMAGHSTSDDPGRYRTAGEVDDWGTRDPILRLEAFLAGRDWLTTEVRADIDSECDALSEETRIACHSLPLGSFNEIFENVLSDETPLLRAQRTQFEEFTNSFE
ncbi:thiamine pyrophosphate-dependent enzyme (plasmid) [Rhodococcus globerulus]|uniref:thiamine pyrophosphate-dependent enzyme n=1 Tax=Rhodococcus globerulus TaxID=33008 RepID=UPI0039E74036